MFSVERLRASIRKRGLWRTVLLVPSRFCEGMSRWEDRHSFDRRHHTRTNEFVELDGLAIDSANKTHGVRYEPTRERPFRRLLARLKLSLDCGFVDFGSGKGRVLLMAAEWGFRRVTGVEFSPELCDAARRNVAAFFGDSPTAQRVRVLNIDAGAYRVEDDDRVFYFFNPFDDLVMTTILKNIVESHDANPRPIHVIYLNPVHGATLTAAGRFALLTEYRYLDCRFAVYSVSAANTAVGS